MKVNKKLLIICLIIPLAVGGIAALITGGGMDAFESLNKPPLSPAGWLFPLAWTLLYLLMGAASYLTLESRGPQQMFGKGIRLYALQLLLNFLWPIAFFTLEWYLFAFIWLLALWVLILFTALQFRRVSKAAFYLMLPYLAWVSFAGYLNLGIYLLN